jgi:glycine/D-amino acid oxidase-like deaminating enzyme
VLDCKLTGFTKRADGSVSQIQTIKDGKRQTIDCDRVILCQGYEGAETVRDHFGITMPVIPVRGYTCDIVPANSANQMPDIQSVFRWNYDGEAYFMSRVNPNSWRLACFLDVAPAR